MMGLKMNLDSTSLRTALGGKSVVRTVPLTQMDVQERDVGNVQEGKTIIFQNIIVVCVVKKVNDT